MMMHKAFLHFEVDAYQLNKRFAGVNQNLVNQLLHHHNPFQLPLNIQNY